MPERRGEEGDLRKLFFRGGKGGGGERGNSPFRGGKATTAVTKREEGKRGWNGPTSSPAWYGAAAGEVYTVQYYSTVGGQGHQDYSGREGRRTAAAAASSSLFPSLSAQRPRKAGGGGCPRPVCVGREREKGLSSIARGGERRERERKASPFLVVWRSAAPFARLILPFFAKGPLSHEPWEGKEGTFKSSFGCCPSLSLVLFGWRQLLEPSRCWSGRRRGRSGLRPEPRQ